MRSISKTGHKHKDRAPGRSFHLAKGCMRCALSDAEFLRTLAHHQCFIVPPFILRARPNGNLERIADLRYDAAGNLDKDHILEQVRQQLDASLIRSFSNGDVTASRFLNR